jgi:hypothetical protein
MGDRFLEHRIDIKFCTKLGKNASDTCALLSEASGGEAMKNSSVFERHKRYKQDRKNVEVDERSGCLRSHRTDENVEKVRSLVHSDGRSSTRAMAMQLNSGKETVKGA